MFTPREQYVETLKTLRQEIVKMGVLVEESLVKALTALRNSDVSLAEKVITEDNVINAMELDIEDRSITLIARENPVAGDLRRVITGMKVVTQLERMGDHAVHIAKSVRRLKGVEVSFSLSEVSQMGDLCTLMNRKMLSAFIDNDAGKARKLAARDEEVDKLHRVVQRKSFAIIRENENNLAEAMELNYVGRYLERFADHITNISEWIIYGKTGNHVDLNR